MSSLINSDDEDNISPQPLSPLPDESFDNLTPITPVYESLSPSNVPRQPLRGEALFSTAQREGTEIDVKPSKNEPSINASSDSPPLSTNAGFAKPKKNTKTSSFTKVGSFKDDLPGMRYSIELDEIDVRTEQSVNVQPKKGMQQGMLRQISEARTIKRQNTSMDEKKAATTDDDTSEDTLFDNENASEDAETTETITNVKQARKLMRIANNIDITPEIANIQRLDVSKLARIYEHRSHFRLTEYERKMIRRELLPPPVNVNILLFWLRVLLSFVAFTLTRVINALYVFYQLGEGIYRIATLNPNAREYTGWQPTSVYLLTGGGIGVTAFEVLVIALFLLGTLWSLFEIFCFRGSSVPYYRTTKLRLYVRRLNFSLLQFSFSTSLIVKIISNTFTSSMNSFKLWTSRVEFAKARLTRGSISGGLFSAFMTLVSLPLFALPIVVSVLVVPGLVVLGTFAVLVKTMFIYQVVVRKNISEWGALEALSLLGFINQLSNAGSGGRFPREQLLKFYDDITSTVRWSHNTDVGPRVAASYAPKRQKSLIRAHTRYVTLSNVCCALNIVCFLCFGWIAVLYRLVVGGIIRFTSDVDVSRVLSTQHFTYSPLMERIYQSLISRHAVFLTEVLAALYVEIMEKERLERTIKILHFLDLSTFVQYDLGSLPLTHCDQHVVSRKHLSGGVSIKIVKTCDMGSKQVYELQARNHRVMGYVLCGIELPRGVLPTDCSYDVRASIISNKDRDIFLPPKSYDFLIARFTTESKTTAKLSRKSPKLFPGVLLKHNTKPVLGVHVQEWTFGTHRVITLHNQTREHRLCEVNITDLREVNVNLIYADKTKKTVQIGGRVVTVRPFEEQPYAVAVLTRKMGEHAVPYKVRLGVKQGIPKDHKTVRGVDENDLGEASMQQEEELDSKMSNTLRKENSQLSLHVESIGE